MKKYHGEVRECICRNSLKYFDTVACSTCSGRRYVAQCLNCQGRGYLEQDLPGAISAVFQSPCSTCGAAGCLPAWPDEIAAYQAKQLEPVSEEDVATVAKEETPAEEVAEHPRTRKRR